MKGVKGNVPRARSPANLLINKPARAGKLWPHYENLARPTCGFLLQIHRDEQVFDDDYFRGHLYPGFSNLRAAVAKES